MAERFNSAQIVLFLCPNTEEERELHMVFGGDPVCGGGSVGVTLSSMQDIS